jgi:2-polyprenyl-3-methyl-5-hydroxy-6-metoxy-1,4-benzoquinol methylase
MPMKPLSDAKIIDSWHGNALPWTRAVREGRIESRRLVTDRAILDAVLARAPRSVLDLGCGEGWLAHALAGAGIEAVGIDAVPALIEQARAAGPGDFRAMSYEDFAAGQLDIRFDAVACNFSLLGEASVEQAVAAARSLLNPGGAVLVQTLHPLVACGDRPYRDGWRAGSWAGFGAEFSDPAPWYFRTVESWIKLFSRHALRLTELREPLHPATDKPASILFIAEIVEPRSCSPEPATPT